MFACVCEREREREKERVTGCKLMGYILDEYHLGFRANLWTEDANGHILLGCEMKVAFF